jgi:hypothetical protein
MTAQVPDCFIFKGEEYSLIGVQGQGLAKPQDFGMKPLGMSTANYRGFFSTYEISEDGIFLKKMTVSEEKGNYKPINGIIPTVKEYAATYEDINLHVLFTGQMRLAKDFIWELYVHMGFQKPSAFKTVMDLTFDDGRIMEIQDRSEEVSEIRGGFKHDYESSRGIFKIFNKIKDAFSLDMKLK